MVIYFNEISLRNLFYLFVFNRSYVALLLVPRLLLVYKLLMENSVVFVLLIGLELKAAKEVCIIIAIHPLLYTCLTYSVARNDLRPERKPSPFHPHSFLCMLVNSYLIVSVVQFDKQKCYV